MIPNTGQAHPYPGMVLPSVAAEPWPEGVVFRALTDGWATVDVRDDVNGWTHRLSAQCTGELCEWKAPQREGLTFTFHHETPRQYVQALFDLKRSAQLHAESCRVMRRPEPAPMPSAEVRRTA